jgi:hypothetical protein
MTATEPLAGIIHEVSFSAQIRVGGYLSTAQAESAIRGAVEKLFRGIDEDDRNEVNVYKVEARIACAECGDALTHEELDCPVCHHPWVSHSTPASPWADYDGPTLNTCPHCTCTVPERPRCHSCLKDRRKQGLNGYGF